MTFENQQAFYRWCTGTEAGRRHMVAVQVVSESDAKWFEENPGEDFYVRDPLPNEFPPLSPTLAENIVCVLVHQIGPGVRIRAPYECKKNGGGVV